MSWQAYVDSLMAEGPGGHKLAAGAICGLDGGIWAQSAEFPAFTTAELLALSTGLNGEAELTQLQSSNFTAAGEKYLVINSVPEQLIRAKSGKKTLVIRKTNAALVVGLGVEPDISPPEVTTVVENIATALLGYGY